MSAEQGGDAKVPEQGEVERLRREAQDAACIYHGRICYGEGDLHAAIDALADLAKRYREERDAWIARAPASEGTRR